MQIEKRDFIKYVLLNCLTLGIYGFITSVNIGKEVNALCSGDGEEPRYGFAASWAIMKFMPLLATIVGALAGAVIGFLLCLLAGLALLGFFTLAGDMGGFAFGAVLVGGLLYGAIVGAAFGAVSSALLGKVYYEYWWYKLADRLHLNANRFDLVVKEKGTDTLLLRSTLFSVLLSPLTVLLGLATLFVPMLILGLLALTKSVVLVMVFGILFAIVVALFGTELSGSSVLAMYFIIKNVNRFADVYRRGAVPFDAMAYEYYPSEDNKYPNYLPGMINGTPAKVAVNVVDYADDDGGMTGVLDVTARVTTGSLIGINGSCAGYNFELNAGEEIVIGKDAKMSMVVIDPAYKEISRKHVGVCYDIIRDQYRVVDYSSNGTWANGSKLVPGQEVYLPHGTELKLANDKNTLRLG